MSVKFLGVEPAPGTPLLEESVDQTQEESNCLQEGSGGYLGVHWLKYTLDPKSSTGFGKVVDDSVAGSSWCEETLPGYEEEEDRDAGTDGVGQEEGEEEPTEKDLALPCGSVGSVSSGDLSSGSEAGAWRLLAANGSAARGHLESLPRQPPEEPAGPAGHDARMPAAAGPELPGRATTASRGLPCLATAAGGELSAEAAGSRRPWLSNSSELLPTPWSRAPSRSPRR